MSSRFLCVPTLGLFLMGSLSLLAAPTKEEKDVDKYSKMLKTGKKPEDKVNALKELCRLGTIQVDLTKPVVPEIIKALDDKDEKVRAEAATTIGHIDPENKKEIVEKLRKMLKDDKEPETVKLGIAEGLSAMGGDAMGALPELRELNEKANAKKKNSGRPYQMAIQAITGRKK